MPRFRWTLFAAVGCTVVLFLVLIVRELNRYNRYAPGNDPGSASTRAAFAGYVKLEGHSNRGARFEHLAVCLAAQSRSGTRFSQSQVRQLLGAPDLVSTMEGRLRSRQELAQPELDSTSPDHLYFYKGSHEGEEDAAVVIQFRNARLDLIGFSRRPKGDEAEAYRAYLE